MGNRNLTILNRSLLIVSILVVILFRNLILSNNILNIDELFHLGNLNILAYKPIIFDQVIPTTTGPVGIYYLSIAYLFTSSPGIYELRIVHLFFIILPILFISYKSLPKNVRWIGLLFLTGFFIHPFQGVFKFFAEDEYYASNTEYIVILFLFIIYYLQSNFRRSTLLLIIVSLLYLLLFLVKFQAILFVFFLSVFFAVELYFLEKRKAILFFCFLFLWGIIFISVSYQVGILSNFYVYYIKRNLIYSGVSQDINFVNVLYRYLNNLRLQLRFYVFFTPLMVSIILFGKSYFTEWKSKDVQNKLKLGRPWILFLVSFLTVTRSTNNFPHYYILYIPSIVILLCNLWEFGFKITQSRIQRRIKSFLFISFLPIIFQPFLGQFASFCLKNEYEALKNKLGTHGVPPLIMGANVKKQEWEKLTTFLKSEKTNLNKKPLIYISGWQVGNYLIPEVVKKYQLYSKFMADNWNLNLNDKRNFRQFKEELSVFNAEFLKFTPEYFVDSEDRLKVYRKYTQLGKFIDSNYKIIFQSPHYSVYKKQ